MSVALLRELAADIRYEAGIASRPGQCDRLCAIADKLESLAGEYAVVPDAECEWTTPDDPDFSWWDTDCGEAWTFVDGGPKENGVNFCMYCGKRVSIAMIEAAERQETWR